MDHFITIKAVLDYIENRVTAEIPVEEVAEVAGFSTAHLRELFRNTTGQAAQHLKEALAVI